MKYQNKGMEGLEEIFIEANKKKIKYVGVIIQMKDFKEPELIINRNENIKKKLTYYKKTYDQNLNHKYAEGIRIIGAIYGDSLDFIEEKYESF